MPVYSRYEVLHYFTRSLGSALERAGVRCRFIHSKQGSTQELIQHILLDPPDCTLSFNGLLPDNQNRFLCDFLQIPHVACLVDSAHYFLPLTQSPYTIITCVDRFGCDFFRKLHCQNVFFLPHAADRSLLEQGAKLQQERPYDLLFLASFTDHAGILQKWKERFDTRFIEVLEEAAYQTLQDRELPYANALANALDRYAREVGAFDPASIDFIALLTELENYIRGKSRFELLKAIKKNKVHLVGEHSDRWKALLGNPTNVIAYPQVTYPQALQMMQESKIVLNSSPFFKNGGHERVFTGMASGAVVATNENLYLQEHFHHDEEILFYNYPYDEELDEKLFAYLKDPEKCYSIVTKSQIKVREGHTWDHRALSLLQQLEVILQKF